MILDRINKANDIKNVPKDELDTLATEIRKTIVETVSNNGGHLSSSLGVVELTMALHLALDLSKDKIVWDVGHQAYAHKILTGRKKQFATLRQENGISGFPSIGESTYDSFGSGHASTSISAALGLASARELKGEDSTVVAVIGDGALTGGMVYEALNNAGRLGGNLIIILNDNEMSISRNVGGVHKVLNNLRTDKKYNDLKFSVKNRLAKIPGYGDELIDKIHKTKSSIKQFLVPGMLFEDMGITYLGPIDGYDIDKMVKIINMAKRLKHAVLIHVHTKKGKGYSFSEKKPSFFHGVDPFDMETGKLLVDDKIRTYSDVLSSSLIKEASTDDKVIAITAAMSQGCGLKRFEKKYPERFFDVGIAEEHAVTFAAGLAAEGYKPYVAIYSTFLQRSFDQIIHDVCIQDLPVRFIVERAGIVGQDGVTHQGIFDISYLNIIPNITILAPKNRFEFRDMLDFSYDYNHPIAIRIPKGEASECFKDNREPVEYGKSEVLLRGEKVAILAVGSAVEMCEELADRLKDNNINPTLVNARFIKPIDEELIDELVKKHKVLVTVEENVLYGGYGASVLNYVNDNDLDIKVINIALPDEFIPHGDVASLRSRYDFTVEKIVDKILKRIK